MHSAGCSKRIQRRWPPQKPARLAGQLLGAAVLDALLHLLADGRVVYRLDPAALQVSNDPLQALAPPIHL
jgi:hypothetical protein